MGRPERRLDPHAGPVQRFAHELRELRASAGRPSYRELARRAHYSTTALSEAAGGERLPSKAVALAYVRACGGDPAAWEKRWHAVAAELEETTEIGEDTSSPYLGLTTFEPQHAELFFGRAEIVANLCERLADVSLLAVFGASGSGKSSILRAGLLPAVSNGDGAWRSVLLTPGRHPVEELAARFGNALGVSAGSILADLLERPARVGVIVRQIHAKEPARRVLVVVDQFEEVFTLCLDERERAAFIDALIRAAAVPDDVVRVVLGVRADFYARCARYPDLVAALRDRQLLVGPMDAAGLRAVVCEPAARAGVKVESALVEAIIADAGGEPGALPLVSHALYETWRRRTGEEMTLRAYRRAGGVQGAIAQTAEQMYGSFDADARTQVKNVFLRLTALGEGTEDTRRRAERAELTGVLADEGVLARLAAGRLVVINEDTVEVAHEALIRSWPRLRAWLAEDREQLLAHRRLTDHAAEWRRHGRDDGVLYRGARLAAWQDRDTGALNDLEREFLEAGRRGAEAERRAARRRLRIGVSALVTAVATLTVLTVVALGQAERASTEERLAFTRQLVADARAQLQLDPELALLLAGRAYEIRPGEETEAVLRQATLESRVRFVVPAHNKMISGVSYSPDGDHVATSGRDGAIQVWRRGADGALHDPIILKGHEGDVWSPVFSPDGELLAAGGMDGKVTLWNWASGGGPRTFEGHEGRVWSVAFDPGGRRVASAGDDGTIRFWNVDGTTGPVLRGHKERTLGVSFSPDGERLASSSGDLTVRIWDLAGRRPPVVLRGHQDSVESVAYSPDGRHLATASTDGTVRVWNPRTPGESLLLGSHDGTAEGVGYSRDGRRVVSTGNDGIVRIWDAARRSRPLLLRGHRGTVPTAAFSRDGRQLTSVGEDGTARVWEATEVGGPTILRGHEGAAWTAATGPGGRIASVGADGTLRIWNSPKPVVPHPSEHEPVVLRAHEGDSVGVAISPDGRHAASTGLADKTVKVWDLTARSEPVVFRGHEQGAWTASFSPDGRRVATPSNDGTVRVWSLTGEPPVVLTGDQGSVRGAAFSPDGTRVAGAGADGTVRVWNADGTGTPVTLAGHSGMVWTVAFSPDGRLLASGGNDGSVRIWRLDARGAALVRDGHQGIVWNVAFSPDGRLLASSGNDGTVRLWKTTGSGQPLVVTGFGASVETVVFAAADRLVSTHDDGTVRVWSCQVCGPVSEVLRAASKRVTRDLTPQERLTYLHESTG